MKALATADLHLSANKRDRYRHAFQTHFRNLVRRNKPDYALILGDLTEEKDKHGAQLVNEIVDHFRRLAELVKVIILRGNHDYIDPDHPYYRFLSQIKGITWIQQPTAFEGCLFLPHTHNYKRDWKDVNMQGFEWIFCHQTFRNADLGHGQRADGIPVTVFPQSARVVSGDVHVPQRTGPVTFVGAPYSVDFGDDYEPRVLLVDGDKLEKIPVHGPQKRLVEITSLDDLLSYSKLQARDIVKVRVTLDPSQADQWPKMQSQIQLWGAKHGFVINMIRPRINVPIHQRKDAGTRRPDKQMLKDYASKHGVNQDYLKVANNIMAVV